jgi:hypothetical protein
MAGYITDLTAAYTKFYNVLVAAHIKDTATTPIEIDWEKKDPPESVTDCPKGWVIREQGLGGGIETDQPDIETPSILTVVVIVAHVSQVSSSDADDKTDVLLDKVITALNADNTLTGLVEGMKLERVMFDNRQSGSAWYSRPMARFTMKVRATGIA